MLATNIRLDALVRTFLRSPLSREMSYYQEYLYAADSEANSCSRGSSKVLDAI